MQYSLPFFTKKLKFCYLNISKNIQLFKICLYHSKASLLVSIKLVSIFHEAPPDGSWGLSLNRWEAFLDKAENAICLIKFFSNWYSDLGKK